MSARTPNSLSASHLEPRDLPQLDHPLTTGNHSTVSAAPVGLGHVPRKGIVGTEMEAVVYQEIGATEEAEVVASARVEKGPGAGRGAEALREVEVSAGLLRRAVKAL